MPAVKAWVAAGIATPRLTSLAACARTPRLLQASAAAATAARAKRLEFWFMGLSPLWSVVGRAVLPGENRYSWAPALRERHDDDHEALHRGVQVHADDVGQIQDVADH